eukprot:jgi/Tetstr1/459342/TSEL_004737.t1
MPQAARRTLAGAACATSAPAAPAPACPPPTMKAAPPRATPQVTALVALGVMVAWTAALGGGCAAYEFGALAALPPGTPRGALNPLLPFDRLLRAAGPALPLAVPALRAGLPPTPGLPAAATALALYAAVAAARIALYLSFQPGGVLAAALGPPPRADGAHAHWLSDHVLLGASMLAQLGAEAGLLVSALYHLHHPHHPPPPHHQRHGSTAMSAPWRMWAALALAAILAVLTAADMHITARFFHPPAESLRAWTVGAVLFQAPLASWAIWATGRPASARQQAVA